MLKRRWISFNIMQVWLKEQLKELKLFFLEDQQYWETPTFLSQKEIEEKYLQNNKSNFIR